MDHPSTKRQVVQGLEVHVGREPSGRVAEEAVVVALRVERAEGVGELGAEGGGLEGGQVDYCSLSDG